MKMSTCRFMVAATLAALLAGCTGLAPRVDGEADAALSRATLHAAHVGSTNGPDLRDDVQVRDGIWIGKTSMRLTQADVLPDAFSSRVSFNRRVRSLAEFAERVSMMTGISAQVTPDAIDAMTRPGALRGQHTQQRWRSDSATGGASTTVTTMGYRVGD